jgi:hypothetical protein
MWDSVGDECEAYLAGRLAAHLQARHRPVPPAGWLNQLVHASPEELAVLATGANGHALQPATWRRAVGYLAQMLLQRARETGRPTATLQRELLVPMELELLADPDSADLDPADLIRLTLGRLFELPGLSA